MIENRSLTGFGFFLPVPNSPHKAAWLVGTSTKTSERYQGS